MSATKDREHEAECFVHAIVENLRAEVSKIEHCRAEQGGHPLTQDDLWEIAGWLVWVAIEQMLVALGASEDHVEEVINREGGIA